MPQISAWVADLQAKRPQGKVRLIHEANHLVKLIRQNAHNGLRLFAHPAGVSLYMWTDAAWASRPDGFWQGGYIILAGDPRAVLGDPTKFSVIDWGSHKPRRVARSSLSAEGQSASDAEGELPMTRPALREPWHGRVDLKAINEEVQAIPATIIMDCKAMCDGLVKSESAGLGVTDRRSAIELVSLRQSLRAAAVQVR
jgi:hypothetical protein